METITLDEDITIFVVQATSYPEGIMEAHQNIHALIPFSTERRYYGLSRPEDGKIIYWAAAEEIEPGEGQRLGCPTIVIKAGRYYSIMVHDFIKDISSIDRSFKQILTQNNLDPEGYCVEWYLNDNDVQCMVRQA